MCLNVRNLFAEYPIPPKSAKATARLDTGQQPDATYRRHLIRIQIVLTVLLTPVLRVSCYGGLPIILSARSRLRCIRAGLVRSRRHAIPPPTSSHHIHGPHQPGLLHAASRVTCPQISGRGLSSPVQLSAVRRIPAADTDTGPSWAGMREVRRCAGGAEEAANEPTRRWEVNDNDQI